MAGYIPRWYTRPKTVTHPITNRARRALTSFMRRTPLTTTRHCLQLTVAPPGFCNGGSEVWVYRGSRVRSPPVPDVLSVYQRGSLLDGLAIYLSCGTKKFHDNESTHTYYIIFGRPPIGVEASPLSPWRRHCLQSMQSRVYATAVRLSVCLLVRPVRQQTRHCCGPGGQFISIDCCTAGAQQQTRGVSRYTAVVDAD